MKHIILIIISFGFANLIKAEDTLRVALNKTIHVAFPLSVKYCDVGSSSIMVAETTPQTSNILRIKAQDTFRSTTNFSVITSDDNFYSFTVVYQENITKFLYDYRQNSDSIQTILKDTVPISKDKDVDILDRIYHLKRNIHHIGSNVNRILLSCDGIYVHKDTIYLSISLLNNSPLTYKAADYRIQIEDNQSTARSALQITPLTIISKKGELMSSPKSTSKAVLSIPQSSLTSRQRLSLYVYENKGNRNLTLIITSEDLANSIIL